MTTTPRPRDASARDIDQLLPLWGLLFDEAPDDQMPWREHARIWFESAVAEPSRARFPVIEIDGAVVACAVGTVEIGIPNPHSPHGRAVRLANVVTRPEHRRKGYGTALVQDVVDWARRIRADRIDLSATPAGLAVYARAGFSVASAPRLKLML